MEGSILMDYHILFIFLCFIFFILTILTLFGEKNRKQEILVPIAFIGVNMTLCIICMLGFFSIDLIGPSLSGGVQLTESNDMWMYYIVFEAMLWINSFMMFYAVMRYIELKMKELPE